MTDKSAQISLNESIARKDLALRKFAQKIAHDTNNYYGVIQGYVSLLEMLDIDDEDMTKYLVPIKSAVNSGIALNQQISSLYRSANIMVVTRNLADLVRAAAAEFVAGNDYTVDVDGTTGELQLDAPAVTELINDLCTLAKTAGNPKASFVLASVTLTEDDTANMILDSLAGKFAEITFKIDTAKMDQDDETKFFNPFIIAATGSKELGVGGVFALLRNHHGNIDVTSHDQTMTIKIYFPKSNA